ncbi:MAG: glycosyltransferase family 4 protein [bacterium]
MRASTAHGGTRPLRVVQVSFHTDLARRAPEELLEAWPTLSRVACAVQSDGVDVTVVQAAHTGETIVRDSVTYHFVHDARGRHDRVIQRAASLSPDVVHVQGLGFARAMRPLGRSVSRAPVFVQDHGAVPPRGWRALAWRWAYAHIAGVSFTASAQADPWKAAGILKRALPVFAVLEGSTDFNPGNQDAARTATGMSGDPCVFWTGRLNANKDPLTALAAFERAAEQLPDARLWCCFGDAPMLDIVRQRIASSSTLAPRVALLGNRPHAELEARYRAADFFLQTSHREGSGYSLLEALACGTTPLVTDIPAARQIVADAGALTPVGDAMALAAVIVDWSRRERASLRLEARARFDAALTFDAIGKQLRATYEALTVAS